MLVARRDPPLQTDAADHLSAYGHPVRHTSRFMTAVQVISTLVAIPVGLASVYSIYRSNFTVEARCATLRGNIVSMLDKSADASTLRMLVRRDVVTFETDCGAVDPDAVKAFKTLLTAKAAPAPAVAPPPQAAREPSRQAEPVKSAAPPKAAVVEAKPAEVKPAEAKPIRRDAATSDANWIASVRDALVHTPAPEDATVKAPPEAQPRPAVVNAAPVAQAPVVPQPAVQPQAPAQASVVHEAPPISLAAPAASAPTVAPALPEPVPVAAAPTPAAAADHPVPPGSIPDAQSAAKAAEPTSGHSWLAKIPLVNRVVGD
jgi:hypothetical protein